jgi:hypothetical protein
MAGHLEALAGVGDVRPIDLKIEKSWSIIPNHQIAAVRRKHCRFGQALVRGFGNSTQPISNASKYEGRSKIARYLPGFADMS